MSCLSLTTTALCVKATAHSVPHRGPTPIKVWHKPGMRLPLVGNSDKRWGNAKFPVPADCCVFSVAVPTVNLGTAQYMLNTGASAENYMSVALESTTPVALFRSARLWSLWVQLDVNLLISDKGEVRDVVPRG